MNNNFWNSDTYAIVKAMKASGNQPGLIEQWKSLVEMWANSENSADATAVKAWLPHWQARPFYTAEELVPLWPALAITVGWSKYLPPLKSARRLEFELGYAGVPSFLFEGRRYFVCERLHYWREKAIQMSVSCLTWNEAAQEIYDVLR